MQYVITDTSTIQINETSGTIQNISSSAVELSNSADFEDSFVLYPLNQCQFTEQLYIRAYGGFSQQIEVRVAPFFIEGGGKETAAGNAGQAFSVTSETVGVLKENGLMLKTVTDSYGEIGGAWTVEFFVQSKRELKNFPQTPALHFYLQDKNDTVLALATSKAGKFGEHPSESIYIGQLDFTKYYFDTLESTLSDGQEHHAHISYLTSGENSETGSVIIFVDGQRKFAQSFDITLEGLKKLAFGGDAFTKNYRAENKAEFDRIRLLGRTPEWRSEEISVPTADFSITEETLLLYQDGVLLVFAEENE